MIFDGEDQVIIGVPATRGEALIAQKASDYSIPVVIASDQSSVPVSTTPVTPEDKTGFTQADTSTVTKLGGTASTAYTIPNGETIEVTNFRFGGYLPTNTAVPCNAKCTLYHRPNGSGNVTGQTEIFTLYLQHSAQEIENFAAGEVEYTGDGTAVMEMDITNWSQQDAELFRQIRGYY